MAHYAPKSEVDVVNLTNSTSIRNNFVTPNSYTWRLSIFETYCYLTRK